MKSRRVFVTLELETDVPLNVLRDPFTWMVVWDLAHVNKWGKLKAIQAQANAARSMRAAPPSGRNVSRTEKKAKRK